MSRLSEQIRRDFKASDDVRDAGLTTPEKIQRFDDIVYATDDPCQRLDVYRPKAAAGQKLPVIISVHGGGWVYGDKELYQYYCMDLATRGFAVVNFTYRLAPEHKHPAQIEDINHAVKWALEHGAQYDMDVDHIFMVGDSAGAHMLGIYTALCVHARSGEANTERMLVEAMMQQDADESATADVQVSMDGSANEQTASVEDTLVASSKYKYLQHIQVPSNFLPKSIILNCGVYDIRACAAAGDDTDLMGLMEDLMPEKGSEAELESINVLRYIDKGFPPVLVMTGEGDFLAPQAPMLVAKLVEHNVPHAFQYWVDRDSGQPLYHVFHLRIRSEIAKQCNDAQCAFFCSFCEENL